MTITEQNISKIKTLCEVHNVEKLYLFGSATNANFSDKSELSINGYFIDGISP